MELANCVLLTVMEEPNDYSDTSDTGCECSPTSDSGSEGSTKLENTRKDDITEFVLVGARLAKSCKTQIDIMREATSAVTECVSLIQDNIRSLQSMTAESEQKVGSPSRLLHLTRIATYCSYT